MRPQFKVLKLCWQVEKGLMKNCGNFAYVLSEEYI